MNDTPDRPPAPFWEKPLDALSNAEWELLCDGCGRCCLVKLEDEDTGDIHFTSVACKLLEPDSCRCGDYPNRQQVVPDCVRLSRENVGALAWLPRTCAYRLREQGKPLPDWHPLRTGDPESVARAGISVRDRVAASEEDVPLEDLPDYIVKWPNRWPQRTGKLRPPARKR